MNPETDSLKKWRQTSEEAVAILGCLLIFVGFTCSRALVSIGMAVLVVAPLAGKRRGVWRAYFTNPALWTLSLYFFLVLFSGWYSNDKSDWLTWVRIKVPYLILPVAFAALRRLDDKKFVLLLYGFMGAFFVSTGVILWRYALHFEAITESFRRGSALAIPFSHIRYSLMLAFAFFCAVYLIQKNLFLWKKSERYGQLFFAVFAFAALHLLSVRSGLLALYLGIAYLLVLLMVREKKTTWGALLLVLCVAAPIGAYYTVPSWHNKINYMRYDLAQYRQGNINNYSDAMRLASMEVGLTIWKENKWIGCGAGDLKTACAAVYRRDFPQIEPANYRLPHNQFIWVLATAGLIGLALFLIAFFLPFIWSGVYRHWLAALLGIILFSSFFTEHSLEEQMGTGFYLVFLLLLLNRWKPHE